MMEETPPSECFIVNFIPDESFINSVITNKDYEPFFESNISSNKKIALVYHSSESINVFKNE